MKTMELSKENLFALKLTLCEYAEILYFVGIRTTAIDAIHTAEAVVDELLYFVMEGNEVEEEIRRWKNLNLPIDVLCLQTSVFDFNDFSLGSNTDNKTKLVNKMLIELRNQYHNVIFLPHFKALIKPAPSLLFNRLQHEFVNIVIELKKHINFN